VGGASREAVVVLKIGWCPDLGGRAVVSVRQAVGAGFGCLAGGMPVIRADAAGLVQEAIVRVADERVLVKEVTIEAIEAADAALSMVVKISERCEAVPACMESMGLLIEVIQMVLSPAVSGAVVDRCVGALAVLATMAVEIIYRALKLSVATNVALATRACAFLRARTLQFQLGVTSLAVTPNYRGALYLCGTFKFRFNFRLSEWRRCLRIAL
jgi:hypothetical protein